MVDDDRVGGPLHGVRVLDMVDTRLGMAGRFLADLGADVVLVEPPGGVPDRSGLDFHTHHANKRSITVDLTRPPDRKEFHDLLGAADIFLESATPGTGASLGLGVAELDEAHPALVHVSITDFGLTGPLRDWMGTADVHLALAGVLSRSGLPGLPPLLPPEHLAYESAAIQAAWAALLAYYHRLQSGRGDHVDFSVFEAVTQNIDPGFGIGGSARGALAGWDLPRGRPDARHLYPIFRCADGWARVCVLSPRQWQGMWRWLGEPEEFADPKFGRLGARSAATPQIHALIEKLFAELTRAQIVEQSQVFGVPAAGLLDASEVLENEHFTARGAFVDVEVAPGVSGRLPSGFVEVDGRRAGFRHPAPEPGEHDSEVRAEWPVSDVERPGDQEPTVQPFAGLRVLDLGVIVVGAELGRLFADHGAEVIKIESRAYPDGSRQSDNPISPNCAWGHRNKRSLGLNLRHEWGRELFLRLVEQSDLVLSNFKPGTLEKLGLGYEQLAEANPQIIVADSSAFGATGPWRGRLGYGPLVRATVGVSGTWRYPDDQGGHSDAITVYPDHVTARVSAVAVLAKLLERRRTSRGGTVSVSQAETILNQMSTAFLQQSLSPEAVATLSSERGGDSPRGVFGCAGDDEWCVVDVQGDAQFAALCGVLGRAEWCADRRFTSAADRLVYADVIQEAVDAWTRQRPPREAARLLQEAGVPAGYMQRGAEVRDDPHLMARRYLVPQSQPQFDGGVLPAQNAGAIFRELPAPLLGPAPMQAENTREVAAKVLGLTPCEIGELLTAGVLEESAHSGSTTTR